ncbi:T9SS type A sorting domain-containing protein [bacterium]|nr:T9SS type A sorting domain-containing protein [bacterium]
MVRHFSNICLTALCIALLPMLLMAQPEVEWQRNYGGEDEETFYDLAQTTDGGFIMVGRETSFGDPDPDSWVVRTDQDGEVEWTLEYNGEEYGIFRKIIQTRDDGFLFATNNAFVVKVDEDGDVNWSQEFQFSLSSAIQTSDGSYSIAGGTQDFTIMRLNERGEEIWTSQFGGDESDHCCSHIQTNDGGFVLVGSTDSFDAMRGDALIVKIDADGEPEWYYTYGGRREDYFIDVIQTEDGDYVMVGYNLSISDGAPAWLLKINEDGDVLWEHGNVSVQAVDCVQIFPADGEGFTLVGVYYYPSLYRANGDGEELWSLRLNDVWPDDWDYIRSVTTNDGGYAIGFTDENERGNLALLKLSPDPLIGAPAWQAIPDISFDEDASLELDIAYFFDCITDSDDPDSSLVISVENGEHVFADWDDETLIITSSENWWGTDSLIFTVTDPHENFNQTSAIINVASVNDPPNPFVLLVPEDNWVLNSRRIMFAWDEATQNEFEIDAVDYSLVFSAEGREFEIEHIEVTTFLIEDIEDLLENLDVEVAEDSILVTWSVNARDESGETECEERFKFIIPGNLTFINEGSSLSFEFALFEPSPNPFNSTTTITYSLPLAAYISLTVYDPLGRKVTSLFEGNRLAGFHSVTLTSNNLTTCLYFVQLAASNKLCTQKVMLIR